MKSKMQEKENLYNNFVNDFSNTMCEMASGNQYSNILFVCIGTDRITGDSFGPLVGQKLNLLFSNADKINVIGNLDNPVSANNASNIIKDINNQYTNPFVIAVDAALSTQNNVGTIAVNKGGLHLRSRSKQKVYTYWRYEYKGDCCTKFRKSSAKFENLAKYVAWFSYEFG